MEVKKMSYEERIELLKDLFSSTNIILVGAYCSTSIITSNDIVFAKEEYNPYYFSREDFPDDNKEEPKLILIHTNICTG